MSTAQLLRLSVVKDQCFKFLVHYGPTYGATVNGTVYYPNSYVEALTPTVAITWRQG